MFADYLGVWLWWIPITGEHPPAHYLALARIPLTKFAASLAPLAIVSTGSRPNRQRSRCVFAVRHSLWRGLASFKGSIEQTREVTDLLANAICQLQLSWNILQEPELACVHLLGLELIPAEA